jgi:hypothetical protein
MGELLDLLAEPIGVELFYGIHDARVDVSAALVEHSTVCDVVSERVLKRVLQVRKEPCRVKKFSSLQIVQETAKLVLCKPTDCKQESERGVVSNYRRLMKQTLLGGGQRVDTRSEDSLHRGRDLGTGERPGKPIATAYDYDDGSIH